MTNITLLKQKYPDEKLFNNALDEIRTIVRELYKIEVVKRQPVSKDACLSVLEECYLQAFSFLVQRVDIENHFLNSQI